MKSISQKHFYDSINPQYLRYEDNKPYASYLVGKIVSLWKEKPFKVLEVGAGQGRFSFELAKYVSYLLATDISPNELNLLVKLQKITQANNISVEEIDVRKISKKHHNRYSAVAGFHVLHHIPKESYPLVAKNLRSFLKNNGQMTFIEPNNLYPFHLVEMMITPDMKWEIEKGIYTNYIGSFRRACLAEGLIPTGNRKFGFFPPPFINKFPWIIKLDRIIERIPLFNEIFCPFVLLSFQKES